MRKSYVILTIVVFSLCVSVLGYFNWISLNEIKNQERIIKQQQQQVRQQIALILLSSEVPDATLEGLTQVDKVYIAQVTISGASAHLYAFISGQWFDLGEGSISYTDNVTVAGDNKTGGE